MTMLIPKPPSRKNTKRLRYIRSLPCLICNRPPPSEAAHVRMGLAGGMGLKPPDMWTVPLCHDHHAEQHRIGEPPFWEDHIVTVVRKLAESL